MVLLASPAIMSSRRSVVTTTCTCGHRSWNAISSSGSSAVDTDSTLPNLIVPRTSRARIAELDGGARAGHGLRHLVCVEREGPPLLREPNAARNAVEQAHAELLLKLAHLHRDRGLRVAQPLGRPRERAVFHDREERLDAPQLHGLPQQDISIHLRGGAFAPLVEPTRAVAHLYTTRVS